LLHNERPLCVPKYALDGTVHRWSSPADGASRGGDWCEAVWLNSDAIVMTIGDVAGHGEPAGETMEAMRVSILQALLAKAAPSDALSAANDTAFALGDDGVIVTAIAATLDRRQGTLTFANAGHPPPIVMTAGGHGFAAKPLGDLPLGAFAKHHCSDFVLAVPDDALIVFYTDGITEHDRDVFRGEEELIAACRSIYGVPVPDVARAVANHVLRNVRGDDDAAVLALRSITSPYFKGLWTGACGPGGYRFVLPESSDAALVTRCR